MLTICLSTCRGAFPLTDASRILAGPDSHLGTYDILASSLEAQTCHDYQLICVDKFGSLSRSEVTYAARRATGGVEFYRPRSTPWTKIGAFAACAARNVGLIHARGDIIANVDDAYSLSPRFVERILALAAEGKSTVPLLKHVGGECVYGPQPLGAVGYEENVGGMTSYPLAAAIAINGWDERFDGCRLSEDVDFGRRLMKHGVQFWRDEHCYVTGYYHAPSRAKHLKCPPLVMELSERRRARGELRGNVPWSAEELEMFETCGRGKQCFLTGQPCGLPPEDPEARRLRLEYESNVPWLDIDAERKATGTD